MSETYFKATRLDGRSFYDGTTRWQVGKVTHLPEGSMLPYLSVSVAATGCTGMKWPCRLFRVEPVEGHEVTTPSPLTLPNKRGSTAWRVVEELDARQVFGPNADEVLAILERARTVKVDEALRMASTRDVAYYDAYYVARATAQDAARWAAHCATWDAARAARHAFWSAAYRAVVKASLAGRHFIWDVAFEVVRDVAFVVLVRDLITQERYETLMGPWWAGVGR